MFSTDYANICPRSLSSEQKEVIGVKRYEMDVKYHGILLGKKGVTVKALEKASGATIRFETSPQGALIIMGTDNQRQVAWKLITSVQATLPKILSQIRDQNIRFSHHPLLPNSCSPSSPFQLVEHLGACICLPPPNHATTWTESACERSKSLTELVWRDFEQAWRTQDNPFI